MFIHLCVCVSLSALLPAGPAMPRPQLTSAERRRLAKSIRQMVRQDVQRHYSQELSHKAAIQQRQLRRQQLAEQHLQELAARRHQEMRAMSLTARQQSLIPPAEDLTSIPVSTAAAAAGAAGQPWPQARFLRQQCSWHRHHQHTLGSVEEDDGVQPQHLHEHQQFNHAAVDHIVIDVCTAASASTQPSDSTTQAEIVPATLSSNSSSGGAGTSRSQAVPVAWPKRTVHTASELCTPLLPESRLESAFAAAAAQSQQPCQQYQPPPATDAVIDLSHAGSKLLLQRYFSSSYQQQQQEQQQQASSSLTAAAATTACTAVLAPLGSTAAPAAPELFGEVSDLPSDDSGGGRDSCSSVGAPSSIQHWPGNHSTADSRPSSFSATPPAAAAPFPVRLLSKARDDAESAADGGLSTDQGSRSTAILEKLEELAKLATC